MQYTNAFAKKYGSAYIFPFL